MSDTEAKDRAAVHFPPPLVFIGSMAIAYVLHRWLWPLAMGLALPFWLPIGIGVLLVLSGFSMILMGSSLFKKTGQEPEPWTTTPEIISTGIYRYSRNPMYVGMALIQAGIGVAAEILWIIILTPAAIGIVYQIAVRQEEAYLEKKFGQPFQAYQRSTRRWL